MKKSSRPTWALAWAYTITAVKVTELDLVNDLTRATITYQPKDIAEGNAPAAVSQISATQPVAASR